MAGRSFVLALAASLAALVQTPAATAQQGGAPNLDLELPRVDEAVVPRRPTIAWSVECRPSEEGDRLRCRMSQVQRFPEQELAIRVDVFPSGAVGNRDAVLRVGMPHGVVPSALVGVQVDGGELFKISVNQSDAQGLYASAPIGRDFLDAMRAGRRLVLSVVLGTGEVASIPLSLYGFTAAHDTLARLSDAADP